MSKISRYALPNMDSIRNIMGQIKEIPILRAFGLEKDFKPGDTY